MPKFKDYQTIDELPTVVTGYPVDLSQPRLIHLLSDSERQLFIRKVYTVLWFQILFTSVFIGLCNQIKPLSSFMVSTNGQMISSISCISLLVLTISLFCCHETMKQSPYNWIFVTSYTILMTYMLGIIGIVYSTQLLLMGGLMTLGIFSGLTMYAWQTNIDYTKYGNYLLALLLGFIIFGFFATFIHIPFSHIIYSSIGTVIFSFYIIYDTQLIIGGENKFQYTTDDFAIASISLYLDIINLFLFIMDLLNGGRQ